MSNELKSTTADFIVLRGQLVSLHSDEVRPLITDIARSFDEIISDSAVMEKYGLSAAQWEELSNNETLLQLVREEVQHRALSGISTTEAARVQLVRGPKVLGDLMTNKLVSSANQIGAIKQLQSLADGKADGAASAGDKVTIRIFLDTPGEIERSPFTIEATVPPKTLPPPDAGELQ